MKSNRLKLAGVATGVALLTIWLHWPSVHNGILNWDDNGYLGKALELQRLSSATVRWAFTTMYFGNYHPLTWLSHTLDVQLWGLNPLAHHATNVLLHGLNVALVVIFVWLLTGVGAQLSVTKRFVFAAGVGVVFGIHPMQVESVAWISERKNLLCGLFSLGSLCAYVRTVEQPQRGGWYWTVVVLFVVALLSKPMAVSLPVVMLAMDVYPLRRVSAVGWQKLLREKLILFAVAILASILTVIAQSRAGAIAVIDLTSLQRCLVAARGLTFYLWKLVWPAWLSPFYPLGGEITILRGEFLVPIVVCSVLTAVSLGTTRIAPSVLATWSAFVVLILPVSGLVPVGGQAAADRYVYLAMLPVALLAASGCVWVWGRVRFSTRAAVTVLLSLWLTFLAVRTRQQITVWRDDVTLWSAVVSCYPESRAAYRLLAQGLVEQSRFEEALPFAEIARERLPGDPLIRSQLGLIYTRLSMARAERWQLEEARVLAEKAVAASPDDAQAHATLGLVQLKSRRYAEAVQQLTVALSSQPELSAARYNLACAYSRLGRFDVAMEQLRMLFALEPRSAQLAERDPELADLRNDPHYAEQFRALLKEVNPP